MNLMSGLATEIAFQLVLTSLSKSVLDETAIFFNFLLCIF